MPNQRRCTRCGKPVANNYELAAHDCNPGQHRAFGRDLHDRAELASECIDLANRAAISLDADGEDITAADLSRLPLGLLSVMHQHLRVRARLADAGHKIMADRIREVALALAHEGHACPLSDQEYTHALETFGIEADDVAVSDLRDAHAAAVAHSRRYE